MQHKISNQQRRKRAEIAAILATTKKRRKSAEKGRRFFSQDYARLAYLRSTRDRVNGPKHHHRNATLRYYRRD